MSSKTVALEVDENKWFDTLHLKEGLKQRSIKGGVSTVTGQAISFILTTASYIVLARLLLPADYGLVEMVASVTGFAAIFKDLGLSSAVIQKQKITQTEVNSVFWMNVLISLGIALVVAMAAPGIVYFYQEPRLLAITLIFALNIFIVGLSLQHNALMKRQMRFTHLTFIQIGSVAMSLLGGVIFAWLGFGYWALVFQGVIFTVVQTVALWWVCDWKPNFSFDKTKVGSFLKFGAGVTGFDVVNHFSRNMDNVFIGKFVGPIALGLYSKAYQLLMLPITQLRNPLNTVALPAMSTLHGDPAKFKGFYTRYLFILAFFSMPLVVFLGVFADELIFVILGEQWVEAGPLFQILAIGAFVHPIIGTTGLILITTGQVKRYFNMGLYNALFTVAGFGIGVYMGGVKGVAISQAVVVYTLFFPILFYNLYKSPVSVAAFLKEIIYPLLFSLASGGAMLLFAWQVSKMHFKLSPIFYCAFGFLVGAAVYLLLMVIFSDSRKKAHQILELGSFLKSRNSN